MSKVNLFLAEGIALATQDWEECREYLGKLCLPEWLGRGDYMPAHMIDNYINVSTPITMRLQELDAQNQAILFRALEKLAGSHNLELEY